MLRKTSGMANVLADALRSVAGARGEEANHSDVDVLVIGEIGFADVIQALHPAQEIVQREINPVVYRAADFNAKLAANNTWAREVVEKPKLFLIGDADDFAKLIENPEPHRTQSTA